MLTVNKYFTKGGNLYPKFTSRNFVVKWLMKNYCSSLFGLTQSLTFNSAIDVGCGEGEIISLLREYYPQCFIMGIDIDEKVLEKAKQRNKGIEFKVQNIMQLDIPDNSFDLVICLEVLEHLDNPVTALKEIVRISKKYILCSVPNEPIWSFLNLCRLAYIKNLGNTPGHIQKWSKKSFVNFLSGQVNVKLVKTPIPRTMVLCEVNKDG
jgi:ubiquinone/menaquinone biosynthesis C-methylase UbiE